MPPVRSGENPTTPAKRVATSTIKNSPYSRGEQRETEAKRRRTKHPRANADRLTNDQPPTLKVRVVRDAAADPFIPTLRLRPDGMIAVRHNKPLELTLAKDTDFARKEFLASFARYTPKFAKVAGMLYVLQKQYTDNDVSNICLTTSTQWEGGKLQKLRDEIKKWGLTRQKRVLEFFVKGVNKVRELYGGDHFDLAPPEARMRVWEYLWDRDPTAFAENMCGAAGKCIDFEGIFVDEDDVLGSQSMVLRRAWKGWLKKKYLCGCEFAVQWCLGDDAKTKPARDLWRIQWRALPSQPPLQRFNIGDFGEVPVRPGALYGSSAVRAVQEAAPLPAHLQ